MAAALRVLAPHLQVPIRQQRRRSTHAAATEPQPTMARRHAAAVRLIITAAAMLSKTLRVFGKIKIRPTKKVGGGLRPSEIWAAVVRAAATIPSGAVLSPPFPCRYCCALGVVPHPRKFQGGVGARPYFLKIRPTLAPLATACVLALASGRRDPVRCRRRAAPAAAANIQIHFIQISKLYYNNLYYEGTVDTRFLAAFNSLFSGGCPYVHQIPRISPSRKIWIFAQYRPGNPSSHGSL